MNDQCKHCTVQGDMPACINTPCSQHACWFAKAKSSELSRAYALIEKMREALSACQISIVGNVRAVRLSGSALEEADTFLAERVK